MSATVGNQSRKLNQSLRELTALFLSAQGIDATATPIHAKISSALEHGIRPDVDGIPGVWIDVSARGDHRLSVDLDSARESAAVAGYPVTALIQHRGGRGIDAAFVVLELGDFVKLLRAEPSP